MKKIVFFAFSLLLLTSCSNDDNADCPGGLNETWFANYKSELNSNCNIEVSIFKGSYEGETVYYDLITDGAVNFQAMITFYNCNGDIVAELTSEESTSYLNNEGQDDSKIFTCTETN